MPISIKISFAADSLNEVMILNYIQELRFAKANRLLLLCLRLAQIPEPAQYTKARYTWNSAVIIKLRSIIAGFFSGKEEG